LNNKHQLEIKFCSDISCECTAILTTVHQNVMTFRLYSVGILLFPLSRFGGHINVVQEVSLLQIISSELARYTSL